jgi:hypothetical protein
MSIKPLTKKQLREIVACYHTRFPGWLAVGGDRIVRFTGPVLQQIGFEALSGGDYRPASVVRILAAPGAGMLDQFLDVKHRQASLLSHTSRWQLIVAAMEAQIVPSIRLPLDPTEVLRLCEQTASNRSRKPYAFALAGLNAAMGDFSRAKHWIEMYRKQISTMQDGLMEWEREQLDFLQQLQVAIDTDAVQPFIAAVVASETERYAQP